MIKRILITIAFVFGMSMAQQSTLTVEVPTYIFVSLNVKEVIFDFSVEDSSTITDPGKLSLLDTTTYQAYYPGGIPVASASSWKSCLIGGESPGGVYQGTVTPPTADGQTCRFSPTQVKKSNFRVNYIGLNDGHCTGTRLSDADLLIISNSDKWAARVKMPSDQVRTDIQLHVLPLTILEETGTLCKYWEITVPTNHDLLITNRLKTLSREPNPRLNRRPRRRSYFTQYSNIYTVPLLYYIEVNLDELDPTVVESGGLEFTVTYVVVER